jgi:hypothetical protein
MYKEVDVKYSNGVFTACGMYDPEDGEYDHRDDFHMDAVFHNGVELTLALNDAAWEQIQTKAYYVITGGGV